jgi:hypothetical protein
MGLVNVVGLCMNDFPDGTTGRADVEIALPPSCSIDAFETLLPSSAAATPPEPGNMPSNRKALIAIDNSFFFFDIM